MNTKHFYSIYGLIILIAFCYSGFCQTKKANGLYPLPIKSEQKKEIVNSANTLVNPDVYVENWKKLEEISELRAAPSTNKKIINQKNEKNGNEEKITLYYSKNRIITIMKRVYDANNKELGFNIFDFDDQNNCFENAQKNAKEKMSYFNAVYWDTLIRFDAGCKVISLTKEKKAEIIQSTKASLDSIMQNFSQFKYSINWK